MSSKTNIHKKNAPSLLGSHVSVAGGLHEGVRRLVAAGGNAMQVFTKNSNQWAAKPITDGQVDQFQAACREYGVAYAVSHDSYLINLAAGADGGEKSYLSFVDEIRRCERYGIGDLVFHPGAHLGIGVEAGLKRVAERVVAALEATSGSNVRLLIEITAGQGTCLCADFSEVRDLLGMCGGVSPRLAVCFDTCHAHASGHDLSTEEGAAAVFDEFCNKTGLGAVQLFHLNDAKKPCGSRADRHEHIGRGTIGPACFRALAADRRFGGIPKVIETEKGVNPETGVDFDVENLTRLRSLGL